MKTCGKESSDFNGHLFLKIAFVLLLTFPFSLFPGKIDSLKNLLSAAKSDTDRINLSIKIAGKLLSDDSVSAEKYTLSAIQIAQQSRDNELICKTFDKAGYNYYRKGFTVRALALYRAGLACANNKEWKRKLYTRIADLKQSEGFSKQCIMFFDSALFFAGAKDYETRANLLQYKGRAYYDVAEYKMAMDLYIQAQTLYEKNNLFNRNYAHLLHFIGSVFKRQGARSKALEYYEKELELARNLKDTSLEGEALYLCAAMYGEMGNLDKELEYLDQSLKIYRAEKNQRMIALILGNISISLADKEEFEKAIGYSEQALKIYIEMGNDENLPSVYRSLGNYHSRLGHHKKALGYLEQSLEAAKKRETKQLLNIAETKQSIAFVYSRMGDYKNAFNTYLEHRKLQDSLESQENHEYIHNLESKYGSEKKEQEIAFLNIERQKDKAELGRKETERKAYLFGGLLVLALAAISVVAFISKKRSNKLLAKQFEEIHFKNLVIQEKNKDITDSIQYAKRIQEAVLPLPDDMNSFFSDSFVFFRPKDIVSGDFYWFTQLGDQAVFAVGDCTGHGVPGAFMSIIGHDLLNQIVLEDGIWKPADILAKLDKRITTTLNKKGSKQEYNDGMDIAICLFDRKQRKIEFSGANRPLIIRRDDKLIEVPQNKFAIGGVNDSSAKNFVQHEIDLNKGDVIYLFSDGYQDQFGGAKVKKLKYSHFKEFLKGLSVADMKSQRQSLTDFFEDWKGQCEQIDDVCVVGIKV